MWTEGWSLTFVCILILPGAGSAYGEEHDEPDVSDGSRSVVLQPPAAIGSRLELFVDDAWIERMEGVSLLLHHPVPREVILRFDAPWEGPMSAYVTVLQDGDRFRMYYRGGGETTEEVTCLAESTDGIRWERPKLGLFEFREPGGKKPGRSDGKAGAEDKNACAGGEGAATTDDGTQNNIVFRGRRKAYWESHNFTPFIDSNPAVPPDQRYKAVGLGRHVKEDGEDVKALVALVSYDGIHWGRLQEAPIILRGSFDSQNVAFWDVVLKRYVCYLRAGREGKRSVMRSTSEDFVRWSDPEWLDFGPVPLEHFYTNAITPYFRDARWYLGFPMRFVPERKTMGASSRAVDGVSDAVLISSRDGIHFRRTFLEAFIRPGPDPLNWGNAHGNNTPAWGLVQTAPGEISIYWCEHYGGTPQVRRGTLRTDGFASAHSGYAGGELVTKALVLEGTRLVVNYSTSAVGSVRVEVQDAEGRPVPGFTLVDCPEIYGDEIERMVEWKGNTDLSTLAGRTVRLRFVLRDADLYSLRFR